MARIKFHLISTFLWFSFCCGQEPVDNDCECVPYYLCNNGTINTNGEDIIDIRMTPGGCNNYLELCCNKKDVSEEPITRSPPVVKKTGCGYRNSNGVGFRISGFDNEAAFGEFPWTVNIMQRNNHNEKYSYKCGGSLIHPQVVLTAAHCIRNTRKLKVRAGEWDTQTVLEVYKHQERSVKSAVVHRDFNKKDLFNDVSLLFLDSPFNISEHEDHINITCLPTQGNTLISDSCFVNGWGKDKFEKDGIYQNIMKKVELPMMERSACEKAFRKTRLGKRFILHKSFICAGGEEDRDACTGDGGSPLVCPIPGSDNRYQQVGIVSWGIGCGTKGLPGVYVDVAHFRDWIDRQMNTENFDTNGYTF